MSVHLGHIANDPIDIGFPGIHAHDGEDGVDPVVLLAVDRFHIETIDLEDAEDVSVLHETLGNAIPVVPHVVGLLVEREPVEGAEVHVVWIDVVCDRDRKRGSPSNTSTCMRGFHFVQSLRHAR